MVDFRRWITALAVLAVFAGLACAQIGTLPATPTPAGNFLCTGNAASVPQLRSEGFTELIGDIVITCTGGTALASGAQIPQTNITVYVLGSSSITSRLLGNASVTNTSEALLLIDDPGSALTATVPNYGPAAGQVLCATPLTGCVENSLTTGGVSVAVSPGTTNQGPNVFQGLWNNGFGANTVTFYGVPILPPSTAGISHSYRVTNVRVTTAGVPAQTGITAQISATPTSLPLTSSSLLVGIVANSLTTSVSIPKNTQPFLQCNPNVTNILAAQLNFAENGVGTAFKTRVVPLSNTLYSSQGTNSGPTLNQNIPGGTYANFFQDSESGFIFPALTTSAGTAGLADYGTRLKAIFTNIPTGVSVYVSVTSTSTVTTPGGTAVTPMAVLVSSEGVSDSPTFAPVAASSSSKVPAGSIPLAVTNGSGTAVWEVVNANPNAVDTLTFNVWVTYAPNTAKNQPTPTSPAPFSPGMVQLWYAPEPSQGAFAASAGPTATSAALIPRFTTPTTTPQPWLNITICQTALLWPYVTAAPGFDTGLAIANTSSDPFNGTTVAQNGSCTLNWYGTTQTATGTGASPPATLGCDQPSAPALCVPVIPSGTDWVNAVSILLPNSGFSGYMIAVCNFQYAHGYAAITDLGIQHILSSYLALVMEGGTSSGLPNYLFRPGVPQAETFAH